MCGALPSPQCWVKQILVLAVIVINIGGRHSYKCSNKCDDDCPGGAGSGVWTRGSMIAWEKKSDRVRLSTNALKINMEDFPSIVVIKNLSWSSSVNRLLLLFLLALVNLDRLRRESQTSWMESKRLVEESLTAISTCSHLMENLLKVFYCQALVLWFLS